MNETRLEDALGRLAQSLERLTAANETERLRIISLKRALVKKGIVSVEEIDAAEKETAEIQNGF